MKLFAVILRALALASFLFVLPMHAQANKLLMPGDLIKDHAKYEDDCEKCHKRFDKNAQTKLCMECHKDVRKDISERRGYHGRETTNKECKECHTDHKGRGADIVNLNKASFDHSQTDYPLNGMHADPKTKCSGCHKPGKKFREAPNTCIECHKKDDKHKGHFGAKCQSCHIEKGWKDIQFDHNKNTKYPLIGKHKTAKCSACHTKDLFHDKLQTYCSACHKKDDKHKGNFGPKCQTCHIEKGWKVIIFDHNRRTKYPLLGKHLEAKCVACHKGKLYHEKLKTNCVSCHRKDDKHKGDFGPKCQTCHIEKGWKEVKFDHNKRTKYPLLGKHADVKCASCHKGDLYKDKLQTNCYSCHQKDDKHKGQEGKKCESCHSERSWNKTSFDHRMSRFPLLGRHLLVACKKCHSSALFKDTESDCYSCHKKDDEHKGKLGTLCDTCHNARDWKAWDFNHNKTGFRLDGPHKGVGCYNCHNRPMSGRPVAPTACGSCHDRDDVHLGKFGPRCDRCHEGLKWKDLKPGVMRQ